ncbi:MAG: ABC transporter ATP-binding protein [Tissierellia bacterium]|nr:ABC transporter ATP-binding protein [Tissierellia bacterium]
MYKDNNRKSNRELLRRFLPYYKPYKKIFLADMSAAIFTVVSELTLPIIIGTITNKATSETEGLTLSFILTISLIYLGLKSVEIMASFFMQKWGHIMGAMIEKDMRRDVFTHIQILDDEFFSNTKIGQLIARVTTDLFDVTEFSHHFPEEILSASVKIIIAFIVLLRINISLTILMFIMLPLMMLMTKRVRSKMRKTQKDQRHQIGEINAGIEDSLLGIKVIRSFANEHIEIEKFERNNHRFLDIKKSFYTVVAKFHMITRFLDACMYMVVLIIGGNLLIKGHINAGDFVMYIMYTTSLLNTVIRIVDFSEVFERGMTGVERFVEIMDTNPNIVDKKNALDLKDVRGQIIFDNVTFSYNEKDDKKTVLDGLNLRIEAGKKVALVGPSGGGKTTLTNLIPRFYEVDKGSITIDGTDIRDIKLFSLRNNIGIVHQDVYLFSGTIADNISYGKPDASDQEIIEAAKLAGAMEFIDDLPEGINTYVGERGVKLSGGQKQRISIARVFLKNPPILILDEATSALDNKSEKIVQDSLERLSQGRTTITIAHRLSTIINSDEIIILTDRGIEEKGKHDQLLAKKGVYYKLYNSVDSHAIN